MGLKRNLVQSHEPVKGKLRQVYVARRADGQQVGPVDQILVVNGGFGTTIAVVTAAAGLYAILINGKQIASYLADGSDTTATIATGLWENANLQNNTAKTNAIPYAKTSTGFKFVSSKTFTAATKAPTASNLTATAPAALSGGADVGKLDTTIPLLFPLNGDIQEGQWLCFADGNDIERLVRVSVTALAGESALSVDPVPQAIVQGSAAEFPPYLWDRTSADIDRSFTLNSFTTFNTGVNKDGSITGGEAKMKAQGLYNDYNAAYKTALEAAINASYIHVRCIDPPPNSDFKTGKIFEGRAVVTSAPSAAPVEGNISADLDIDFTGAPKETDPVPVS
jgi:hypothetical protein